MATNTIGSITEFKAESEKIETYLECMQLFFEANGIKEDKQVPVLLTVIGSTMYDLLSNLVAPKKPRDLSIVELAEQLHRHFDPKPLVIAERFHFRKRAQAPDESINNYVAELRQLATHCDFGEYLDQALRDCLVCGICHENMQKQLLSEANLTLSKVVKIACSIKVAEAQTTQLQSTNSVPVVKVTQTSKMPRRPLPETPGKFERCTRCGGSNYKAKECCHRNSKCYKCHKTGHLSSMCRIANKTNPNRPDSNYAKWIDETLPTNDFDSTIFKLSGNLSNPFTVELIIEGNPLVFKVDTGAAVTLISEQTYKEHCHNKPLQASSLQLKTYTEEQLQVLGQMTVDMSYHNQQGLYTLYVVKGSGPSLLGQDLLKHIRLDWKGLTMSINNIKLPSYQSLMNQYFDVFSDQLGTLKSIQAHLDVQPNFVPKFCKPYPVPYALKEP